MTHQVMTHQVMTHPGILTNAKHSRTELKTIQTERSSAVPSIMQLSVYRLFRTELHTTMKTLFYYIFFTQYA